MAKRTKYQFLEPAERPVSIALSPAELIELASCHQRHANRLDKVLAKEIRACKTQRDLKAIKETLTEWFEAHMKRANGLIALASEHLPEDSD
ncbi:MAG: hypothetical protein AAF491_07195 [Verrucomicrobiota bacterium]